VQGGQTNLSQDRTSARIDQMQVGLYAAERIHSSRNDFGGGRIGEAGTCKVARLAIYLRKIVIDGSAGIPSSHFEASWFCFHVTDCTFQRANPLRLASLTDPPTERTPLSSATTSLVGPGTWPLYEVYLARL
jgi:hypothetical protein